MRWTSFIVVSCGAHRNANASAITTSTPLAMASTFPVTSAFCFMSLLVQTNAEKALTFVIRPAKRSFLYHVLKYHERYGYQHHVEHDQQTEPLLPFRHGQ